MRYASLTIARYLIGDRAAILSLGADRSTPLVGAVLVLSAGLARSYHTADLLAQPWHLLTPFAVSSAMAMVLLLTTCIGPWKRPTDDGLPGPSLSRRLLPFLGLFWMTAPLAWLYAIPYERFTDPLSATEAKVWTLAIVAGWRVLLMTRVLSVLTGRSVVATFFQVMLLADGVVWLGLSVAKLPLIQFMALIALTDAEQFVADTVCLTRVVAFLSFPVWLIGAIVAFFRPRCWNVTEPARPSGSRIVWLVAAGSVAAGLLALFWTQPEQRLATRARWLLRWSHPRSPGDDERATSAASFLRSGSRRRAWATERTRPPVGRVGGDDTSAYGRLGAAGVPVEFRTGLPVGPEFRGGSRGYTGLAAGSKVAGRVARREGSPREIRRSNAAVQSRYYVGFASGLVLTDRKANLRDGDEKGASRI